MLDKGFAAPRHRAKGGRSQARLVFVLRKRQISTGLQLADRGDYGVLRLFAGLSVEQVAELREVSPRTVIRDWRRARAFLFDSLHPAAD